LAGFRIPPIQCLLAFEALARLRNMTHVAEELHVTPSAVSHRRAGRGAQSFHSPRQETSQAAPADTLQCAQP
jgi:predicted transcriptional regulator